MVPSMYYHSDEHHVEAGGIMNGPGQAISHQPATDQLLLTDDGNCPQSSHSSPGNEGPACKQRAMAANLCRYLDSW